MRASRSLLVGIFCGSVLLTQVEAGIVVNIAGSGVAQPLAAKAAESFKKANPGSYVAVGAGGIGQALELVAAGEINVAISSRPLSDSEKSSHPQLISTTVATDAIAFVAGSKSGISSLTKDQALSILNGATTSWSAVGGADSPISITLLAPTEGATAALSTWSGLTFEPGPSGVSVKGASNSVILKSYDDPKTQLASLLTQPGALAITSAAAARTLAAKGAPLKLIALDGVAPSIESIAAAGYPLPLTICIVTNGSPDAAGQTFIEYLRSSKGAADLSAAGFVSAGETH